MLKKTCDSAIVLKEGKLEYFKNIQDGIQAYQKYIVSVNPAATLKFAPKRKFAHRKRTRGNIRASKKDQAKLMSTNPENTDKPSTTDTQTQPNANDQAESTTTQNINIERNINKNALENLDDSLKNKVNNDINNLPDKT